MRACPSTTALSPTPISCPSPSGWHGMPLYQFIPNLLSISVWKSGTSLISCPTNTSSHPISVSLPDRMSACTPPPKPSPPPRHMGVHSPARTICSSIPRFTGSAMPNCRRSISICSASCWERHCASRDSRGCVDWSSKCDACAFGAGVVRERLARRVSCTPGAEGAPSSACVVKG